MSGPREVFLEDWSPANEILPRAGLRGVKRCPDPVIGVRRRPAYIINILLTRATFV